LINNSFFGGFPNPGRKLYQSGRLGDLYKAVIALRLSLSRDQLEALWRFPTIGSYAL
jgi:hypothetical protein